MKNTKKIIYWYQSGFKIYNVNKNLPPKLEKEIESSDLLKLEAGLKYLSGQKMSLLLSDSVSYFYEKTIDPPLVVDSNFKNKLLEIIKSDIPEDFSKLNWDFKITKDPNGKQKIIIFAPIKKVQELITQISNKLNLEFDIIEPDSIAITRDPNPIIGIYKKTDIKGKDEDVLNLSLTSPQKNPPKPLKKIFLILIVFIILLFSIFLIIKFNKKDTPTTSSISTLTSTPIPTIITPTPFVKEWSSLSVMVQNGTSKPGLASKTAAIFKTNGINQIDVGNADNPNYTSNELIFKDIALHTTYQDKFKEFLTIEDDNISIDNEITYDVIFIITN